MSNVLVDQAFVKLPADADKRTVISLLAHSLADAGRIKSTDLDAVIDGALAREAIGSTGIGHGIAIPHCRTDLVSDIICAYGHAPSGLHFDSLDGAPVHSVFLLLTPHERKSDHLTLMKSCASQIRKNHFCSSLHHSADAQSLVRLLTDFEGT
ncbi:MAG: PTS sugar transporter subunit IIA [Planctomycetota bacterium]|jgi:mannitol/fructose-specific phosphotransferase system IIA component (Ntr-type)